MKADKSDMQDSQYEKYTTVHQRRSLTEIYAQIQFFLDCNWHAIKHSYRCLSIYINIIPTISFNRYLTVIFP